MGRSCNHKFKKGDQEMTSICRDPKYGPIFGDCDNAGGKCDILIIDNSDTTQGCFASCTNCFVAPSNLKSVDYDSFLAGQYKGWLKTEIKVFQVTPKLYIYNPFAKKYNPFTQRLSINTQII